MSWERLIRQSSEEVWRGALLDAERSLKAALQYATEHFTRDDQRLTITLSLLGHVFFCQHNFERAEQLFEQAKRMRGSVNCTFDPCRVMDLFCLFEIKSAFAQHDAASDLSRELENILQSGVLGEAGVFGRVVDLLNQRLSTLKKAGFEESESVNSLPLPTYETQPGGSYSEVWQQQFQTGLAAMKTDDVENDELITAYLNLESAYRLAASIFKRDDMRLIATGKALADACTRLRLFAEAEALYSQAISAAHFVTGAQSAAAGNSLRLALALLYIESGQFNKARDIFDKEDFSGLPEEAKPLKRRLDEANQLLEVYRRTDDLLRQAAAAEEMNELEHAAKLANNASSQLKQGFPPGHIENARVIRYRGELLLKMGNDEQAMELMQRAERIERSYEAKRSEWLALVQALPKVELATMAEAL